MFTILTAYIFLVQIVVLLSPRAIIHRVLYLCRVMLFHINRCQYLYSTHFTHNGLLLLMHTPS